MSKNDALKKLANKFFVREPDKLPDGTVVAPRWSTGIKAMDVLTGGGFPKGTIVAIGGEEGTGKTTMLLHAAKNIMERDGKKVAYMDVEGGVTYDMMRGVGVLEHLYHPDNNPDGLFFLLSVESIQDVNTVIQTFTKDPDMALIILDSDTNVIDEAALEEEFMGADKNMVGGDARMWSANFKKINAVIKRSNTTLLVVHQARNDFSGFHVVMKPSGGKAAKHVAGIEIWIVRRDYVGEGDITTDKTGKKIKKSEAIGARIQMTTLKNRFGFPHRAVDAYLYFGVGVSNKWAYREWLQNKDIIDDATGEVRKMLKTGAWPNLRLPSGEYKAQGNAGTWKLIEEHWDEIVQYVEDNGGFITVPNDEFED